MSLEADCQTPSTREAGSEGLARVTCRRFCRMELEDLRSKELWKAVAAEFVGCFLLVYMSVGSTLRSPTEPAVALVEGSLAAGFLIASLLSALMAASGAHVNPAVSIGFLVTGQCSCIRFVLYVLAQSVGSITGAALLNAVSPEKNVGKLGLLLPPPGVTIEEALMAEFMITFFLLFCVIAMVDKGRQDVGGSIPVVVGLVVCVNIFYAHNISGAVMNPIRNLGPAVVTGNLEKHWLYWVGPLAGGAGGALLYDRVLAVATTTASMHLSCLSRGQDKGRRASIEMKTECAGQQDALLEIIPEKSV